MTIERPKIGVTFAHDADEEPALEMGRRGRNVLLAIALGVMVALTYISARRGQFILNDEQNIIASFSVRAWADGVRAIWRHPLQMPGFGPLAYSGFLAETKVIGIAHPGGFHAVSALIHAINTVLLWTLLRRLAMPAAFAAAAIFAVHPVNVEAVTWISQQRVLLCAMFYLAAVVVYLRYARLDPAPPDDFVGPRLPRSATLLYGLSILLFVGAILSHPGGATLPLALLVIIWWRRGKVDTTDLVKLLPMLVLAAALTVILAVKRGDAAADEGLLARATIAARAIWSYAISIVLPIRLSFAYPKWDTSAGWQWMVLAGVIMALTGGWIVRSKLGRGPLAAMSLFVIALMPGIVAHDAWQYSFLADHAAYLASAALIAPLVAVIAELLQRRAHAPAIVPIVALIAVVALATLTFLRVPAYNTDESLWNSVLRQRPASVAALNQLGAIELRRNQNINNAVKLFTRALVVDRDNVTAQINIANAYALQGDADKAKMQYYQVLAKHPDNADAHIGLGLAHNAQGHTAEALAAFDRALALRPNDAQVIFYKGRTHEDLGDIEQAEREYRRALQINPRLFDALFQLAMIRFHRYLDKDEAQALFLRALEINPGSYEVYLNIGVMDSIIAERIATSPANKRRLLDDAADYLGQAALLNPQSALAFKNRGIALMKRANVTDGARERIDYITRAIESFDRAIELGDEEAGQYAATARRDRNVLQSTRP